MYHSQENEDEDDHGSCPGVFCGYRLNDDLLDSIWPPGLPRPVHPICFLSNILMIFPVYLSYRSNMPITAVSLTFCMVASMFYHLDENRPHALYVDFAGVVGLTATMLYITMNTKTVMTYINMIGMMYSWLAMFFYVKALEYENYDDESAAAIYEINHSLWHMLVILSITTWIYAHIKLTLEEQVTPLTKDIKWIKNLVSSYILSLVPGKSKSKKPARVEIKTKQEQNGVVGSCAP